MKEMGVTVYEKNSEERNTKKNQGA
jgi:hypothetical protein